MYPIRVFLAGPDQDVVNSLAAILANVEDIEITGEANSREATLNTLSELLPNVVVIDEDVEGGSLKLAEEITQRFVNMAVVILSQELDEDFYRRLLQSGTRDFVVKPVEPAALIDAIYKAYEYEKKRKVLLPSKTVEEVKKRKTKVITVFSNKGGVGKTTVAVNLAVTLAKNFQSRTILWDLDLHHGVVSVATNIVQRRHITDLVNEIQYLDEDLLEGYLERHESGLMVLPAPFTPEFADYVSADHVSKIISVARERWDYVVIDTPSFFTESATAAMRESDLVLLVGSLDLGTIKNMKACLIIMDKLNFSRAKLKLVLNRVGKEFGVYPKDIEATLKMPIFVTIPADAKSVLTGLNQGVPAAYSLPDSDFGRSFQMLANAVAGGAREVELPVKKKGFFARVFA